MNLLKNNIYKNDISKATQLFETNDLKNKSVLITGANGLIGSCIVDMLLYFNQNYNTNIKIYVAGRNIHALTQRFGINNNNNIIAIKYDATKDISFDFKSDYIIHCASNASPDKYVNEPVDTMMCNFYGMHNILQYAKSTGSKKVIYVSSSEVYGKVDSDKPLVENEYGFSDILAIRSSYISSKRATETLCIGFANQYGIDVSIVRPGHIYGPTATSSDMRVSSDFARKAAKGNDIELKSAGTQIRSYCYCVDCASAILWVMLKGQSCEAYNISNKNSIITIREMAEILAKSAGIKLVTSFATENEKSKFNPMNNSSLNSEKLELLGWNGLFDAETGLSHTVQILREND